MWIIQEPKKVALWNKRHFEGNKSESVQHVYKIQCVILGDKNTVYIRVTLYWGYWIVLWLFRLVCVLCCGYCNLFCNAWVCICVGFVMCGSLGNMSTGITVGPWLTNLIRYRGLVVTQVGRKSKLFFPIRNNGNTYNAFRNSQSTPYLTFS
jgi:hypothetical protein